MPENKRRFNILYTIPNFDTAGSGKALLNIASRLDQNYFNPIICCGNDKGIFFKNVIESGIKTYLKETTINMKPRIKGIIKCIDLALYFKSLKIDLIHSFHYGPDYSEALAAYIAGIPWIYTKKNMNWGGKSKNGWWLRTFLSKHIIIVNQEMAKIFFQNKKNITFIARGINLKTYTSKNKEQKLLDKFNITDKEFIILTVANLVPLKGIENLIDVFENIFSLKKNIRLMIVGEKDNEYGRYLEHSIKQLSSRRKIIFTGKVYNMNDYYSIADLFILNSEKEGCPVALLEAMACGVKVIGSDIPGIRDILKPAPESIFKLGDEEELKKMIIKKIKEKNIEENYQTRIAKNYDIKIEVSKHEDLYKHCLIH